jgi:prophage regulatory protein
MDHQGDYVLRLRDVRRITGLGRSSIYRAIKRGEFPAPILLARRASGWRASEVYQWLEERPRRNGGGQCLP